MANVLYTFFPIMIYAILDKELYKKELMENPQYYTDGRNKKYLNPEQFF